METFALYILKSAAWLTGFTLVYILFLRNERFFLLKRYYLVAGIISSFILPLITIHYNILLPFQTIPQTELSGSGQGTSAGILSSAPRKTFEIRYLFLIIYMAGIAILIVRSAKQIRTLLSAIEHSDIKDLKQAKLIRASRFQGSFSFFNYIFINPSINENELRMIMNHELVHVHQKHWFDLLLAEIVRLLQWVNPFAWIYPGLIRQNHEFIADAEVLQQTSDPAVYKAVLVNQLFDSKVFSLSDSFNFSINKKRFDMMKKIVISPYRKLKVLLVIPVFAIIFYAFATPEYRYTNSSNKIETATIYTPAAILQKEVRGTVLDESGKSIQGVHVSTTGRMGQASLATTDSQGNFTLINVADDATLGFFLSGYKEKSLKPDFIKPMIVRLEKNPEAAKEPEVKQVIVYPNFPVVAVDGVITNKSFEDVAKELGYNMGPAKMITGKEATDKYGEKGAKGVYEITTRKKAIEMGMKPSFPRLAPGDYPSFLDGPWYSFNRWVGERVTYPPEAMSKNIGGWVTVNFKVGLDGTVSDISSETKYDKLLSDEVIKVIKTSPKWDPPKNPAVDEPFSSSVTIGFRLPDQIVREPPYVVVEEMPMYPGGDKALLDFLRANTRYPDDAMAKKLSGKVILRFIVNTDGNSEGISVLKGVDPILDAEAIRVVSLLKGFKPGMQGGKPVNVWYMVPVNFSLPADSIKK